ncbi:LOB domain-containing protein 1 [Phtheirospermum japonicum]|uniref:LOB domain-containing protein 1 n=1 Tax=Phtheirospermum japonicum TaxID=374723 RepID=A0A830D507_9LAMI|nr:LOB domain-containing protein 1 [Phtheirospermum japonicum]
MAFGDTTTATVAAAVAVTKVEGCPSALSPTSSSALSHPSPPPAVAAILTPCAACKILRRRCAEKCVLAPYFPPTEPLKFTIAHRVFGASNIIKLLQELPESQRADAVNSMVYEANARLRDPIYGCAGAICHLQKQICDLQAELAKAQAEVLNMQCQNASLCDLICKQMGTLHNHHAAEENNMAAQSGAMQFNHQNSSTFLDQDANMGVSWEPLWT